MAKKRRLTALQRQYVSSTAMASELPPLRTALLERSSCEFYKIPTQSYSFNRSVRKETKKNQRIGGKNLLQDEI